MQKKFTLAVLYFLLCCTSSFAQETADTLATKQTRCILQYISSLAALPDNKVISGQWMDHRGAPETPQTEYDTSITTIFTQTSKWVGIAGTDYMRTFSMPYSNEIKNLYPVNQPLINHFKQGGLVFIMSSFKNPWNNTSANDTTNSGNLLDLVTPGHPANIRLVQYLDSVAKGIAQLQDSGVTVLYRPFQEQNGSWFWWGSRTSTLPVASDFTAVWKYVFNYLTYSKQLHNILWVYCPSVKAAGVGNPAFKSELFYYPGNDYVDIIGLDDYRDTLAITPTTYAALLATGKPLGFAEFGPSKTTVQNNPFTYDYTTLINQIKTKYPALTFWVSWNHFYNGTNWVYYSLSTQNNTSVLLNDNWVINRDEIDYATCLTTTAITDISALRVIDIAPNPFSHYTVLLMRAPVTNGLLTIYNSIGQIVMQIKNINGKSVFVQRNNLAPGLYVGRLSQENEEIETIKLVIVD